MDLNVANLNVAMQRYAAAAGLDSLEGSAATLLAGVKFFAPPKATADNPSPISPAY